MSKVLEVLQSLGNAPKPKEELIAELLERRRNIDEQLASLGYVLEVHAKRSREPAHRYCKYCDMEGHDGRAHRTQGKGKRKFTTDELAAFGLTSAT